MNIKRIVLTISIVCLVTGEPLAFSLQEARQQKLEHEVAQLLASRPPEFHLYYNWLMELRQRYAELGPEVVPVLIKFYRQGRPWALRHLGLAGGDAALQFLVQKLPELSDDQLIEALVGLNWLGDPRAVPYIASMYQTWDESARVQAGAALGNVGGERARRALQEMALYDPSEEVRKTAQKNLKNMNLRQVLGTHWEQGKAISPQDLGFKEKSKAARLVLHLLFTSRGAEAIGPLYALRYLASQHDINYIMAAYELWGEQTRMEAVATIGGIGGEKANQALKRIASQDPSQRIRRLAQRTLARMR